MALSNSQKIENALKHLQEGLLPFVEREMVQVYGTDWRKTAAEATTDDRALARLLKDKAPLDVAALLGLVWHHWRSVFNRVLGETERNYVKEARDIRNRWAHQEPFSSRDAHRSHDTIARLLEAVSSPLSDQVIAQMEEIQNLVAQERVRQDKRRDTAAAVAGRPVEGLKPWREVVTPHRDVYEGTFQRAEFAADLWQVYNKSAVVEYADPTEFFRRTFVTAGLKDLLVGAVKRLSGVGGDPVIELQTSFGGGKTHSMLALYHMCGAKSPNALPGLDDVLKAAAAKLPDKVKCVVLVGTKLGPGQEWKKPDGTIVRTLWGEIAWQLGGKEGYKRVKKADETATVPGDELTALFNDYGPCLILIDEWVAYARQLHEQPDLCGGTFDTHFTFAQTLSESAKSAKQTLLVVSIPESHSELGGERGKLALTRLKQALGRVHAPWRPATADESFEIVRRRLFDPILEDAKCVQRDRVVAEFSTLYRENPREFPSGCGEKDYERRLQASYPIHPELFARLYDDWASLDRFQRTRGVLRLMASVIHTLWRQDDRNLMILPAMVPIDDEGVASELTRYLDDGWRSVIEKDVDGNHSLPVAIDSGNPNLGRFSAARRAARAVFMGSAPTLKAANRGLEDVSVKLACVQPGEIPAVIGDALRHLTDRATFLYVDGRRYWYSTQPSVTRLAEDRAQQQAEDMVFEEIKRRLRAAAKSRGDFARVHAAPGSTAEVPDESDCALVVLGPEAPHQKAKNGASPARREAMNTLDYRGPASRIDKNALVFLAADQPRLEELVAAVRQYLAWTSIWEGRDELNLDTHQRKQAEAKAAGSDKTVDLRILEAWTVLLYPEQADPNGPTTWQESRLQPAEELGQLAARVSRKLKQDGALHVAMAPSYLRQTLESRGVWKGDHVALRELAQWVAAYVYLPRFATQRVLADAVAAGLGNPMAPEFAYADGFDQKKSSYLGLVAQRAGAVDLDGAGLLVKRDVAERVLEEERLRREGETPAEIYPTVGHGGWVSGSPSGATTGAATSAGPTKPTRYHGSYVFSDATKLSTDAGRIAQEIIQHINALPDAEVQLTLEIAAHIPSGVPERVVRIIIENGRTLRVAGGFE